MSLFSLKTSSKCYDNVPHVSVNYTIMFLQAQCSRGIIDVAGPLFDHPFSIYSEPPPWMEGSDQLQAPTFLFLGKKVRVLTGQGAGCCRMKENNLARIKL
jgi:hypothetical protein